MLPEATLGRGARLTVIAVLAALTLAAWLMTVRLMGSAMTADEMGGLPGGPMAGVMTVAMWCAMMTAMMLPSTVPVLALVARIASTRCARREAFTAPWVFVVGYLLVWLGAAMVCAGIDLATPAAATAPTMMGLGRRAGGLVLVAAGVYQFTPLKAICLRHCRSPMGFILTHWREGRLGAVRLGISHGLYCLGCCWVLMLTLLALSALGLAWALALSLFVFVEKALPWGDRAGRAAGVGLALLGAARLAGLP